VFSGKPPQMTPPEIARAREKLQIDFNQGIGGYKGGSPSERNATMARARNEQRARQRSPVWQAETQAWDLNMKQLAVQQLNADSELVKRWDSLSQEQKMLMPPESRKRIESMRIRAVVLANEEMMKSRNQQQRGNSQASMSGASARSAAWRVAQNKNRPSQTGGQSSDGQQTEKHLYGGGYPIMSM